MGRWQLSRCKNILVSLTIRKMRMIKYHDSSIAKYGISKQNKIASAKEWVDNWKSDALFVGM